MKSQKGGLVLLFLMVLFGCTTGDNSKLNSIHAEQENNENIELKIEELLSKMTLKEKAGQMVNIGLPAILEGDYWDVREKATFDKERFEKMIVEYGVGSIHNTPGFLASTEQWYQIIKKIQDASLQKTRLGIPVLYGIDNIHGANYVKGSIMFPHQIAQAATWNTSLVKKVGEITSYESRAASLPWNFNPNADVAMNPLWGRIGESFGEDPYLISQMTNAYIDGSQGLGLNKNTSTAVCLKHFIGYGAGKNGKDRANALIPENSLRQYFLVPFKEAVAQGAMGVMISSNAVNGIPCHINSYYISTILKGEMGFKGVVISDFSDVEFLVEAHLSAKDKRIATKMAVNAGLDMIMNPYDVDIVDIIVDLVKTNEIAISRIDDAVTRILRLKFQLNLFDAPYQNPDEYIDFGSKKHQQENYTVASEAITLLKNNNAILPLDIHKKVLVTGYASNSMNVLNGAWSRTFLGRDTKENDPNKLTILDAVTKMVGAENVSFVQGTDYLKDINIDKAVLKAKDVDCILVCVGEIPATEKPSDINSLELPIAQQELIKRLSKTGKPIILVMVQGRPRIIREIEPMVDAIVMGYLPGQEGGIAITDIIYGKINPSGKLPYTYPKYSGNILPYYHKKTDIRDVNWGFDGFDPQYEFGFGLSYTTFEYSNFKISSDTIHNGDTFTVSVDVKNTGRREGKEIVALYLKDMVATISPDSKKLIRFSKITLLPNEQQKVSFELSSKDLMSVGMDDKWIVEAGEFKVFIDGNSVDLLEKNFNFIKK